MLKSTKSRGSALMIALIVVLVVGGMSAAVLSYTFAQSNSTFKASEAETALNTTESGLDDAINKLNALAAITWKGDATATQAALTPLPGVEGKYFVSAEVVLAEKTNPLLDYAALNLGVVTGFVLNTTTGLMDPVTQTTFTGTVNRGSYDVTISPAYYGVGNYTITAHGSYGKERKGLSVTVTPGTPNPLSGYGMVGKVTLTSTSSNVVIDSYKSSVGLWKDQAKTEYEKGKFRANDQGNLGSNGDISVKNGFVFGNVTPGPKSTVTTGSATITGSTAPADLPLDIPSYVYSPAEADAKGGTVAAWSSGLVTLAGGTYHFSDMVTSGSGAGITINGPVVIYVDGDIGMNATEALIFNGPTASLTIYQSAKNAKGIPNNITLNGQTYSGGAEPKASNLQINSATLGDVKFNGGSEVYANVYAPDAAFRQTGTSDFFGKIVASTIDIGGNMTFHRDEDIAAGATSPPVFRVRVFNETLY